MPSSLAHLDIPHPFIALFGSGPSVLDLEEEEFAAIRRHAFVVTLNYAPLRLRGHLNLWSDRKVSDFLEQHYRAHPKACLLAAQEGRVSKAFQGKVDFWFSRKKEHLKGNYTLVWALQLLKKYFPGKPILLFGVDLAPGRGGEDKWYDRYTDYDRRKRGKRYDTAGKLEQCARQLRQYIPRANVFNANPASRLDHFPKQDWRTTMRLKVLHLCPTALAGAPVHLSRTLNKYTPVTSRTILRRPFGGKKLHKLAWDFDNVSPSTQQVREAIEWADLIQYHRIVYPYEVKHKASVILFHSPQTNYRPRTSLAWLNDRKLAVAQYQPLIYTDALVVPNLIDIWEDRHLPADKPQDRVVIFYSWASEKKGGWRDKGSQATRRILRKIKARYGKKIEVRVLNNVPYAQCLAEKRTAHICIDECVTGSYHLQSLEGCSVGALTINNLSGKILPFIQQVTGQASHPFVRSDLEHLFDTLCRYIEQPDRLRAKGLAARQWMEQHWDPREQIQRYLRAYHGAMRQGRVRPETSAPLPPPADSGPPPAKPGRRPEPQKAQVARKKKPLRTPKTQATIAPKPFRPGVGRSYRELYCRYPDAEIYIFGGGPSLFSVDPDAFRDKICFGINYAFEHIPDLDYHFVHVIETYEAVRKEVDEQTLILPDTLVRQHYRDPKKNLKPHRIPTTNEQAYQYPLQEPYEKRLDNKQWRLDRDAAIFCWSTTTHSAIHMAAYMGAKRIVLVGVDYSLFPDGKVHFESRHSPIYGAQDWNALRKHKQGDGWLADRLRRHGITLEHYSAPTPPPKLPSGKAHPLRPAKKASRPAPGRPIADLYRQYEGEDIYIFGSGPSLLEVDPETYRDKICFGINYAFEHMPHMNYILVHEIETYESLVGAVDNRKFILPEKLFRHTFADGKKAPGPATVRAQNPEAYVYPIQDPQIRKLDRKTLSLDPEARIFTWSTTTHSAIHLAAYMGARTIYLIGVDYALYPNGKVHFESRHSKMYGAQRWNVNAKHRQGDRWLAEQLKKKGVRLENLSRRLRKQSTEIPLPKTVLPERKIKTIRVNRTRYQVLDHWFWKQYRNLDWEPDTYRVFDHYLSRDRTYVDLGAWIGLSILYAAERGVRKIFGVEANPETHALLLENCRLNRIPAQVINRCLYRANEPVPFGNPAGGPSMSSAASIRGRREWTVPGITLDAYLRDHVPSDWDLLKIDIEGAETYLLEDLGALADRPGTVVFLSLHPPFWADKSEVLQRLLALAGKYSMMDNQLRPLDPDTLKHRVLSRQAKPRWGTAFGNFFEIVLEAKGRRRKG